LNAQDHVSLATRLTKLKLEQGFVREDLFVLDESTTPNFKDKLEELFEESEQKGDIARLVLEGEAYYDVEDKDGNWCRILCECGDLILIPAHKQYRLTTTPKVRERSKINLRASAMLRKCVITQNYVKMKRLFKK
ncbi:hypothetical protein PMAYCL1PPCAC_08612, partial [Pristionchus mayeri]